MAASPSLKLQPLDPKDPSEARKGAGGCLPLTKITTAGTPKLPARPGTIGGISHGPLEGPPTEKLAQRGVVPGFYYTTLFPIFILLFPHFPLSNVSALGLSLCCLAAAAMAVPHRRESGKRENGKQENEDMENGHH